MTITQAHSQQPDTGPQHADTPPSYDQLHERACIVCHSDKPPLLRVGYRTVYGLPWAVVACAEHAAVSQ